MLARWVTKRRLSKRWNQNARTAVTVLPSPATLKLDTHEADDVQAWARARSHTRARPWPKSRWGYTPWCCWDTWSGLRRGCRAAHRCCGASTRTTKHWRRRGRRRPGPGDGGRWSSSTIASDWMGVVCGKRTGEMMTRARSSYRSARFVKGRERVPSVGGGRASFPWLCSRSVWVVRSLWKIVLFYEFDR